ncbi:Aldehyde dehydrogenase [Kalmanozyma brasiliensis GHG001]|uniref:Aldehyde dehydrogenase n=1 Tax=Kalmanozyma brasiliensis (strain GHG001) TaxID=1365824 RepID=V5GU66_KALBG|nr:Aldehyde dehydrogenase [Kalmanozyma brasiliensis GHG001]EST09452.1 Aldehyde dehydrogenase [Kalmanozyma brasiliensis GHG001]
MAVGVASKLLDAPFSHVINGKTVDTNGAKMLDVIDPATEKVVAQVPIATKETVDQAVDAARAAFASWSKTSWDERAKLLEQYGEEFKAMGPELVKLLTAEQGKAHQFAEHEVQSSLPWFTDLAKTRLDERVVHENDTHKAIERYLPLGVCAGIVPWNFPILLMIWKISQAVITGNCIIIKPSPFTPLCDIRIVEAAQKFFPAGVVQIVVGDDHLGPWITEHPKIQKISFTGSTVTGRLVAKSCSATLKRFTLELGGNDPCVVLPKQNNMAEAAQNVLLSAFFNSGQVCIAAKRIYVHEDIYDEFKATLAKVVQNFKVGPGNEEGVTFGPINNKMQYEKVGEFFDEAKKGNFNFVTGGETEKKLGYFYPLSIVDNPPEDSRLVQEEPFGPIVPLLKWKDEADLLKRVNDSEWGLGSTIWGDDLEQAERIARQIETGTVWVGCMVHHHPAVPFGGMKSSGIGAEHGRAGLTAYTQLQAIWLPKA